jgi:hypothetical protein
MLMKFTPDVVRVGSQGCWPQVNQGQVLLQIPGATSRVGPDQRVVKLSWRVNYNLELS